MEEEEGEVPETLGGFIVGPLVTWVSECGGEAAPPDQGQRLSCGGGGRSSGSPMLEHQQLGHRAGGGWEVGGLGQLGMGWQGGAMWDRGWG